mgnify:CR=1 FL=1
MSEKFKAIIIDNQNEKFTREIKEIDTSHLKDGNVLVKVDYSSLNFKDALILNDGGKIVRKFPFVPGIDFAGTVVESEDSKFKKDDKVILTGFRVGEAYYGGFAQYAKVDSNFLIKIPKDLDSHKAMMLGTAGFTALLCSFAVKAKEELLMGEKVKDVLVTGATGGVGSIAVMILSKMGYDVHAVTGKKDKNDYLKDLGAKNIIDRKEFEGESKSIGKVNNGKLVNGRKFPYNGENYQYFSPFSYYILNRAWTHSKIVDITLETYKECENKIPHHQFLLMECSKKNGGKMKPHRTHQNGTSIDFGTPLLKNGKPYKITSLGSTG